MSRATSIAYRLAVSFAALWILSGPAYAKNTTCAPPDTCAPLDVLWLDLHSSDKAVFRNAFLTLRKEDFSKLYSEIRKLNFENTDEGEARAIMVAQVIARARQKVSPSLKGFDYWKSWYDATNPASAERFIPSYLLFDFHEKIAGKIARSEKNISDYQKWRAYTLENPEGRPEYLSENALTEKIKTEKSRLASLPEILDQSSIFLTENEEITLNRYFRIFEVLPANNVFQYKWRLPFSKTLETAIQTPGLWENKFQSFLKCEPNVKQTALIRQLIALDPNSLSLNSCLRQRLKNTADLPDILQTLSLITSSEILRADPYIRDAVSAVNADNPFTSVRVARQIVLSAEPAPEILGNGRNIWMGPRREMLKALNANRTYCEAGPVGKFPYIETLPKFSEAETFAHFRRGAPIMTVKTPSGYLTGHDRGEFGGGLLYYTDKNSEPETVFDGNMIAIIKSDAPGIYWGLSGLNHLMPGMGTILRIDARTDDVSVKTHKRMPLVTRNVKLLKTGDLFMDFRRRKTSSVQGRDKDISQPPDPRFNPPVVLTRAGEIVSACGD